MKANILIVSVPTTDFTAEFAVSRNLVTSAFGMKADKYFKEKFNKWFVETIFSHYEINPQFLEAGVTEDMDFSKFLSPLGYFSFTMSIVNRPKRGAKRPKKINIMLKGFSIPISAKDLSDS
jgi:hypothetical protein